jgi:hypothetical protein
MYPTGVSRAPEPRGVGVAASIRRQGAMVDGMVSRCELLINVVMSNKPKMLTGHNPAGLSQKATEWAQGLFCPLSWVSGCSEQA